MPKGPSADVPADVVDRIGRAMTAVLREGWRVNEEQLLAVPKDIAVTALVDAALLPIAWLFQSTGMLDGDRLRGNIKLLGEHLEVLAKGLNEPPASIH